MLKGTKAIGVLAAGFVLYTGMTVMAAGNGNVVVPSAGVGEILEANVEEEEYLAAAEEAKIERKAIYGFSNLGIANVSNYLNVREKPSEDGKLVGKMSKNSGCDVLEIKDGWAQFTAFPNVSATKTFFTIPSVNKNTPPANRSQSSFCFPILSNCGIISL